MPKDSVGISGGIPVGAGVRRNFSDGENIAFRDGKLTDEVKAMRAAFKGTLSSARIISSPPGGDVRIALPGQSGLFSVSALVGLRPAPPAPVQIVPYPPPPPLPPLPRRGAPPPYPPPPPPGQIAPPPPGPVAPPDQPALAPPPIGLGAMPDQPVAPPDQRASAPPDRPTLAQQQTAVQETVRQVLPGLVPQSPMTREQGESWTGATDSLLALDTKLRDAATRGGETGYDMAKLVGLLSSFEGIAESSESQDPARRLDALLGLTALADTVLEAIRPPRDGSALNGMIGINAELDGVLKLARQAATETLMLDALADRLWPSAPSDAQTADVTRRAKEVVDTDANLARMKQQVLRAFEQAGIKQELAITGLGGLRVDAALVTGLRNKLGATAEQIGLIVAGLHVAEQAALESANARSLRDDVAATLAFERGRLDRISAEIKPQEEELRAAAAPAPHSLAELQARQRESRNNVRFLEERLSALSTERENCSTRLNDARDTVAQLQRKRDELPGRLGTARAERDMLADNVAMLEGELKNDSLGPKRREYVQATLPAWRTELEERGTWIGYAEAELAALPGRLEMAQKNVSEWRQRLHTAELAETVSQARAGARAAEQMLSNMGDSYEERQTADGVSKAKGSLTTILRSTEEKLRQKSYGAAVLTGGLTGPELAAMGLDKAESEAALRTASNLARRGLSVRWERVMPQ